MEYSYKPVDFLAILKEFAALMGTSVSNDGVLILPESIAHGFARAATAADGLHYLFIKGKIKEAITFQRMIPPGGKNYLLIFIEAFAPDSLAITDFDKKVYKGLDRLHTILFTTTDQPRSITFSPDSVVKLIGLLFSDSWLDDHSKTFLRNKIKEIAVAPIPVQLNQIMQNDISSVVDEIFEMEHYHPGFKNSVENRLYMLADKFFDSLNVKEETGAGQ